MRALLALLLTLVVVEAKDSAPAAKNAAPQHTLAEFKLGKAVSGGSVSLDKLRGKVVVIEAWGVHCGPCIASLPHMQELSVKHKDKAVFIGAESQDSDKASIEAVTKKAGVTYAIVSGLTKCPINFAGIPHAFVFDGTGKMVFDGHPGMPGFADAIEQAAATVAASPAAKK